VPIVGVVVAALPASLSTQSACDKRLRKTEIRSSKGRRKNGERAKEAAARKEDAEVGPTLHYTTEEMHFP